jgi:hypothetical protein
MPKTCGSVVLTMDRRYQEGLCGLPFNHGGEHMSHDQLKKEAEGLAKYRSDRIEILINNITSSLNELRSLIR